MSALNHSTGHRTGDPRRPIGIGARALSIFILGALLCLPNSSCAQPAPPQAASREDRAAQASNPRHKTGQSSGASKKADGVWHHFGESRGSSTQPPPKPGVWHHFGSADSELKRNAPFASGSAGSGSAGHDSAARPSRAIPRRSISRRQHGTNRIGDLERQMFALINRDRSNAGARPLRWNAKVAAVARAHSRDMIRQDYFGHVGPDGKSVGERLDAARIDWQAVGENIAVAPTISQAETEFMSEPSGRRNHRWNILNSSYTEVGVGIARGPDGGLYITQDFMKAPSGR